MYSPSFSLAFLVAVTFSANLSCWLEAADRDESPNIVYIMSDELAYYELSHMGNPKIRTPNIDQFAKEGIRFTQALAAAPVCAPLRCALMTGKHMGHASVRANGGGTPLRAEEPTIASILKAEGYATGGFGKWGAGGRGSTGVPEIHGFDLFYGYYDQVHAHSFYPPYLVRNSQEVPLQGNVGGREGQTYSHYEIMKEGLQFIRDHQNEPFFAYFPITPPHGMYDIPADDPAWELYAEDEWMKDPTISQDVKNYAAMVSMVDQDLKRVLDLLRELDLEENTLVFFTGDNGGQDRFKSKEYPRGFYGPNVDPQSGVEFRGGKGSLYEGGLRIPFLARWPGKIPAGTVSDLLCYQVDIMPTLAQLTGATPPGDADGLSLIPTLIPGNGPQQQHEFLYWEFVNQVAVRKGDWKGIQPKKDAAWALYNLEEDPSESQDLAKEYPELVKELKTLAAKSHEPVRPGTFADTANHERDRQAKWGSTRKPQPAKRTGKMQKLKHKQLLAPTEVSLVEVSSENRGNDRLAQYAIDGRAGTLWHTQFTPELVKGPHHLVLDLGTNREVTGIQYLARQDSGWNGAFGQVTVYVMGNQNTKEEPAGECKFEKRREPQTLEFEEPLKGRFVKIVIESEVNGGPWASAADIGVLVQP